MSMEITQAWSFEWECETVREETAMPKPEPMSELREAMGTVRGHVGAMNSLILTMPTTTRTEQIELTKLIDDLYDAVNTVRKRDQ